MLLPGRFGVHRFYAGKIGIGFLMIITLGGLGIWSLADFIIIACGAFRDADWSNIQLIACDLGSNEAANRGGAIYNWNCAIEVDQCLVKGNNAATGGAMYTAGGRQPLVKNSTFCGNSLEQIAGVWIDDGGNEISVNCGMDCMDLTGDDVGGVQDLLFLLAAFGSTGSAADYTGDNLVDASDLIILIANWGPCS